MDGDVEERLQQLLTSAREKDGESRWTYVERVGGSVSISKKGKESANENVDSFRGQAIVKYPPKVLAEEILNLDSMRSWNPQLFYVNQVQQVLEEEGGGVIFHKVFKAKKCLVEVHRDFVYWEKRFDLPDGTICILAMSTPASEERSKNIAVPAKCIRGQVLPSSGWVLQPWELKGGLIGTFASYVTTLDLKNLPEAVLELAGREQPLIIKRLEDFLTAREKQDVPATSPRKSPRSPRGK